ncbi:unnamed protein product, partial [Rotaria magnacalcarata]
SANARRCFCRRSCCSKSYRSRGNCCSGTCCTGSCPEKQRVALNLGRRQDPKSELAYSWV